MPQQLNASSIAVLLALIGVVHLALSAGQIHSVVNAVDFSQVEPANPLQPSPEWQSTKTEDFSLDFFGQFQPTPVPVQAVQGELPVSSAPLSLKAIYYSGQPEQSAVVISTEADSGLYREADTLPSGIYIESIAQDQVTIKRNGQFETLLLHNDPRRLEVADAPVSLPLEPSTPEALIDGPSSGQKLEERLQQLRDRLKPKKA
nr:type II secretion system protein N [Endozoicomonas acroporae]